MRFVCDKHGSSLHCRVCSHVADACNSAVSMPVLAGPSLTDVICRDCFTPDVQKLRLGLSSDSDTFFDNLEQLRLKIGYSPICTECLYEKTGLDLRKSSPK
jgi:hypothetical protein